MSKGRRSNSGKSRFNTQNLTRSVSRSSYHDSAYDHRGFGEPVDVEPVTRPSMGASARSAVPDRMPAPVRPPAPTITLVKGARRGKKHFVVSS